MLPMKEILDYPKCESAEDVQKFKEFMIDKINNILEFYKGKNITQTSLNHFKVDLQYEYPIVEDIKYIDDGLEIKLNRIFLFSKNLIVNKQNQIVLNNGRFKLCVNNEKELKITEPNGDFSEISNEVYYMVR